MSEIKVRIGQQSAIKVASTSAGAAGGTLSGLSDTDVSAVTNGSVLVYDANTSQWIASNTLTTGNSKNLDINGGSF